MMRCYGTDANGGDCANDGGRAGWCGTCSPPVGYAALAADVIAPADTDRVREVWDRLGLAGDDPDDPDGGSVGV